ncbi:MAG: AraC family transcriptional regulator [Flavitalea sp.]
MNLALHLVPNRFFSFEPKLPKNYTGLIMPGSSASSSFGSHGSIIVQEMTTPQYTIRYNTCRFSESFILDGKIDHTGLQTSVSLKGDFYHRIKGVGNINLLENQFTMLYARNLEGVSEYSSGMELQSFDTQYSAELTEEFKPLFPVLNKLIPGNFGAKPRLFFRPCREITAQIRAVIKTLLQSPYEEKLHRHYIDTKVKEYFFLMLAESAKDRLTVKASPSDTERIHAVKDLIAGNIYDHHTNVEIARIVGMNECKLKMLFRENTGMGMFEYLLSLRLQKAKELLYDTNMSMKEIYTIAGYTRLTNFITGFRKHFSITPGEIRRQRAPGRK